MNLITSVNNLELLDFVLLQLVRILDQIDSINQREQPNDPSGSRLTNIVFQIAFGAMILLVFALTTLPVISFFIAEVAFTED